MSIYTNSDEFIINNFTSDDQVNPKMTVLNNGDFVVTWYSNGVDGSDTGISAKIYKADGTEVTQEFVVNDYTNSGQYDPEVTVLDNGSFVITWNSNEVDGSNSGISAKIYEEDGTAITQEFVVNDYVESSQFQPQIIALNNGNFVVSWVSYGADGLEEGISAKIYNSDGTVVSNEFIVNDYVNNAQYEPKIVALANGGFVVTWYSFEFDPSATYGVSAKVYNDDGTQVTEELIVNDYISGGFYNQQIIALNNGGFVITWDSLGSDGSSWGISAKIYNAGGVEVTEEFTINDYTKSDQTIPQITALADGGFVVTWESTESDGSYSGISAKVYNQDGTEASSEFVVNDYKDNRQQASEITALDDGNFVITWQSTGVDGSGYGISAKIYNAEGIKISEEFIVNDYTNDHQMTPKIVALDNGGFVIIWSSNGADGSGYGISAKVFTSGNNTPVIQDILEQSTDNKTAITIPFNISDEDGDEVITSVSATNGTAQIVDEQIIFTPDSVFTGMATVTLIANDGKGGITTQNIDVNVTQGNRAPEAIAESIVGDEILVNSTLGNNQQAPTITSSSDGGFIISWHSNAQEGGEGNDIVVQRFTSVGEKIGSEILANTTISSDQSNPSIASFDNGGFVVSWHSNAQKNGEALDIVAQRFDVSGEKLGAEILVNTTISDNQQLPRVVSLDDGGFVISWFSNGQNDKTSEIRAQRFDSLGEKIGDEIFVNTTTPTNQWYPTMESLSGGDLIISWYSNSEEEGNGTDIVAQRYNFAGEKIGGEILVNTTLIEDQKSPTITSLENGGFVISWHSNGQENGEDFDIVARIFDMNGNEVTRVTTEDTLFTSQVEAIDPDNDVLTYSLIGDAPAGLIFNNGKYSLDTNIDEYQSLAEGETKIVSFSWEAKDLKGLSTGIQLVNISITGTNDMPEIKEIQDITVDAGNLVNIPLNIIDVDNDELTVNASSEDGTVQIIDGNLMFTSNSDFSGKASVTIIVGDGKETVSKELTIDVASEQGVNENTILEILSNTSNTNNNEKVLDTTKVVAKRELMTQESETQNTVDSNDGKEEESESITQNVDVLEEKTEAENKISVEPLKQMENINIDFGKTSVSNFTFNTEVMLNEASQTFFRQENLGYKSFVVDFGAANFSSKAGGYIQVSVPNESGTSYGASSSIELDLNQWYDIQVTYEAGIGAKIYVDGKDVTGITYGVSENALVDNSINYILGTNSNSFRTEKFNGEFKAVSLTYEDNEETIKVLNLGNEILVAEEVTVDVIENQTKQIQIEDDYTGTLIGSSVDNPTGTFTREYDLGEENAGKIVDITFDAMGYGLAIWDTGAKTKYDDWLTIDDGVNKQIVETPREELTSHTVQVEVGEDGILRVEFSGHITGGANERADISDIVVSYTPETPELDVASLLSNVIDNATIIPDEEKEDVESSVLSNIMIDEVVSMINANDVLEIQGSDVENSIQSHKNLADNVENQEMYVGKTSTDETVSQLINGLNIEDI